MRALPITPSVRTADRGLPTEGACTPQFEGAAPSAMSGAGALQSSEYWPCSSSVPGPRSLLCTTGFCTNFGCLWAKHVF